MSGCAQGTSAARRRELLEAAADDGLSVRPPLFVGILPADYEKIRATGRMRVFTRGELLHLKDDPVTQVSLVTSGYVKVTQLGFTGSEVILHLVAPGDVLGASCLLSTGRHHTTAQAFRVCHALTWDARSFKALTESFPVLHQNMVRVLGHELLDLAERFREIATEKVALRVARQLIRLHSKIGRQVNGFVEVRLSREELAQMTGTTLFTVSRLLSTWEASGIVKPTREAVTICDIKTLASVSGEQ